jgi:hypothetical protein
MRCLSIMHREGIELAKEVEEEKEEALERLEDQLYVTIVNKKETTQENAHFHQRPVCIFGHQIMTQKNE